MTTLEAISVGVVAIAGLSHVARTLGMWWAVNHADPEDAL